LLKSTPWLQYELPTVTSDDFPELRDDTTLYEDNVLALLAQVHRRSLSFEPIAFYGSSSFRMWDRMAEDLNELRVVNLGFGGGTFASAVYYFERVVAPLKPSKMALYFGENDIFMDGMTVESTFRDFLRLMDVVRRRLGPIPAFCLSVKQSPANWVYADEVTRLNDMIADYCSRDAYTTFVDVTACLLGENGRPMGRYFKGDNIHINHRGYAAWAAVLMAVPNLFTAEAERDDSLGR